MEYATFKTSFEQAVPAGTVLPNPGGGTSSVLSYSFDHVYYRRGNSKIRASVRDFYLAYEKYSGRNLSSSDLREFNPSVFDSQARPAGHSCNCTFLFLALERMGLVAAIHGSGVRGSPFNVDLPPI
jgi:hypothetical protein